MPDEFRQRYIDILFKHQEAISINKYDPRLAKNYKHKIHLKNKEPVYRKQFKIPEAHHQFIEQTLEEWLKLRGSAKIRLALQLSYLLCPQETRARTSNCARFLQAKLKLTHRQVFHEGDHGMHWGHQMGKL